MRTMLALALVLFAGSVLASEECVAQLGGKCRAACASDEKPEQGAFTDCKEKESCCVAARARPGAATSAPVVVIANMAFAPQTMKVKAGTEVVWKNHDGSMHTVTADDGSFASPTLAEGGEFRKTFTKPGTYSYTCEMHPFMSGTIVVE
jgi:plastocyanin